MGLFDYVNCEYPIEGVAPDKLLGCQTKDFDDPWMLRYRVTQEGRLEKEIVTYEDRSDPNAKPRSLASLKGCMTPVHVGWEEINHHGWLNFYNDHFDVEMKFTDGRVVEVKLTPEIQPPSPEPHHLHPKGVPNDRTV